MDGINQVLTNQPAQASQEQSKNVSYRGRTEMEFHSLLNDKMSAPIEPPKQNQVEPARNTERGTPEAGHTRHQDNHTRDQQPQQVQNTQGHSNTQEAENKSQDNTQQSADENQKIAQEVKKAVEDSDGEVDIEQVVQKVLTDHGIDFSEINLDELGADIEEALQTLELDSEIIENISHQLADAIEQTDFEEVAAQVGQQLLEATGLNKVVQNTDEEGAELDTDLEKTELVSNTKTKEEKGTKSENANHLTKLEQTADKNTEGKTAHNAALERANQSADDRAKQQDDLKLDLAQKNNQVAQDKDIGEKLELNKNELSLNKTSVTNNQNTLGGVSNLAQVNQVQSKIAQAQQLSIPGKLGSTEFKTGLSERVVFMIKQDVSSASIKLNPPELGPMEISLRMNSNKQADLSIVTQHGVVKDSVEQALPRLRDMLSESGIQLNNVNVSDQSSKQQQQLAQNGGEGQDGSGGQQGHDDAMGMDLSDPLAEVAVHRHRPDGLVDYYA